MEVNLTRTFELHTESRIKGSLSLESSNAAVDKL